MYLDVHTVHEHYGIVTVQTSLQPPVDLASNTLNHPADARLGVVLTVNLIKNISYLLLGQPFCVQHSCQSVTLLFLIAQYGKNLWMKVAITVSRYPELKFSAVAVCVANTISVPFITLRIR